MGMKKIIKQIHRYADENYELGYQAALENEAWQAEHFEDGVRAERKRIVELFKMLSEQQLESGSGTKAKLYREVIDLIKIADMNFEEVEEDEFF